MIIIMYFKLIAVLGNNAVNSNTVFKRFSIFNPKYKSSILGCNLKVSNPTILECKCRLCAVYTAVWSSI